MHAVASGHEVGGEVTRAPNAEIDYDGKEMQATIR